MGRSGLFTPLWQFSMYNNHFGNQNKYKILAQLLPKIVTEAHANLKKKKTGSNTTLKHNMVMQS